MSDRSGTGSDGGMLRSNESGTGIVGEYWGVIDGNGNRE